MKQILRLGERYALSPVKRYILYVLLINIGIVWLPDNKAQAQSQSRTISGNVTSASDNQPLEGASIKLTEKGGALPKTADALTDASGKFSLQTNLPAGVITISYIGCQSQTINFGPDAPGPFSISLEKEGSALDEVQVIGYGQVSKRFNTGSVVTVTAQEIERQPVSNPLAALAGRVPGMTVTQSSGNPGAKVNLQIRGRNSISQGSQPLFIIDGVPFLNDNVGTGDIVMANGGQSPFDNINPVDIEQIDVLKDADATAIYGSRGANGVVLITTRKGQAGVAKLDASVYQGGGRITRRLDLLNTQQYVAMRREAFANDGITPTALNAPDIMLWDTTRYTDWQDEFIGGTARFTQANASLSGGNIQTRFLISGNYNRQSTVYPGGFAQQRGGGMANVSHRSADGRLDAVASTSYSLVDNRLPSALISYINLPPNTPHLLDADGNLVWAENGGTFQNPYASVFIPSTAQSGNLITNLNVHYLLWAGLSVGVSGGYNLIQVNDSDNNPKSSLNPYGNATESSSTFANTTNHSWILEPQLSYTGKVGYGQLDVLVGGAMQQNTQQRYIIDAYGFPNDALLQATAFATRVATKTGLLEYRYQAAFGRVSYNYGGKYLVNVTARRDGSSRFGPGRRTANFGSVGAAWIFSEERFADTLPWLSFGKLRGSFGSSGNDQIGDYSYLDNYRAASRAYQEVLGYVPIRLYNADYSWERNRKLEAALEVGLWHNRVLASAGWFRNRSDNQLINYKLPDQTGFPAILRNFGALVENTGLELELKADVVTDKTLTWSLTGNLTRSRNRLLEFEGLAGSSYANTLVIGYPLSIAKYLHWTGVDPETGIHTFEGTSRPTDQTVISDLTPAYFGGIGNRLQWKNWELDFLVQFIRQDGVSYLGASGFGSVAPGRNANQPVAVLGRWQQPGDAASVQRFTTTGAASTAYSNFAMYSDARITDASFLRLQNLYLGYSLPTDWLGRIKLSGLRVYLQARNLFTLTDYEGLDPETGAFSLPPVTTTTLGLQLSL